MSDSKTFLNVPYAQKDEAKALGARWDAANKKWYVPAHKDISLFAKWQIASLPLASSSTNRTKAGSQTSVANTNSSVNNNTPGVFTQPTIKDFVAYDGDEPPWD